MKILKPLFLIGMMGCGKSRMGKMLSEDWSCEYYDIDDIIVQESGLDIVAFFAKYGEIEFRRKEHEIIANCIKNHPNSIISGGGGAFIQANNRALIDAHCISVYIEVDSEIIWQRVQHKRNRPLLLNDNPKQVFDNIFQARHPIYRQANCVVHLGEGDKNSNYQILKSQIQNFYEKMDA